jgi:hypothetical protein
MARRTRFAVAFLSLAFAAGACVPAAPGGPAAFDPDARASGPVDGDIISVFDGECPFVHITDVSLQVHPAGTTEEPTIESQGCIELDPGFAYSGTFTMTFADGTLSGPVTGDFFFSGLNVAFDLDVARGTGAWCNVRGTIALDGERVDPSSPGTGEELKFGFAGTATADLHDEPKITCKKK